MAFGFKCMSCVRRECSGAEGFKLAGNSLAGMDKPSSSLHSILSLPRKLFFLTKLANRKGSNCQSCLYNEIGKLSPQ